MKQAIIVNQTFVYYLFNLTAGALYGLSLATALSYQFGNIVIWFGLIPATWIYLVSKKTTPWLNLVSLPIFMYMFSIHTWNVWFDKAVVLLNQIGRFIHYDYKITSVIVCVFAPVLVYLFLFKFCTSARTFKWFVITILIITGLIILLFPISNLIIKYHTQQIIK